VETALAGRSHEIKGYTVATQVFGRGEEFNQATDPIVSIQANKLRRALERYYLVAGQNDPVRIDIPKGTYVPLFRETRHLGDEQPFKERRKTETTRTSTWPTIVVQSFENLTGNGDLEYMGIGIATEIALEITRYQEIRVLRQTPEKRQRPLRRCRCPIRALREYKTRCERPESDRQPGRWVDGDAHLGGFLSNGS
jgi:adenylate cyclase